MTSWHWSGNRRTSAAAAALLALASFALAACGTSAELREEPVESESALLAWLSDRRYVVEADGFTTFRAEGVRGRRYAVTGYGEGRLVAWTFGDRAQADRALREIRSGIPAETSANGFSLYVRGPLVVAYVGEDPGLRADLADALGPHR